MPISTTPINTTPISTTPTDFNISQASLNPFLTQQEEQSPLQQTSLSSTAATFLPSQAPESRHPNGLNQMKSPEFCTPRSLSNISLYSDHDQSLNLPPAADEQMRFEPLPALLSNATAASVDDATDSQAMAQYVQAQLSVDSSASVGSSANSPSSTNNPMREQHNSPTGALDNVPIEYLVVPRPYDVFLGPDSNLVTQPGNKRYVEIIKKHVPEFAQAKTSKQMQAAANKALIEVLSQKPTPLFIKQAGGKELPRWQVYPFNQIKSEVMQRLQNERAILNLNLSA